MVWQHGLKVPQEMAEKMMKHKTRQIDMTLGRNFSWREMKKAIKNEPT
jgi:hypothetical protein